MARTRAKTTMNFHDLFPWDWNGSRVTFFIFRPSFVRSTYLDVLSVFAGNLSGCQQSQKWFLKLEEIFLSWSCSIWNWSFNFSIHAIACVRACVKKRDRAEPSWPKWCVTAYQIDEAVKANWGQTALAYENHYRLTYTREISSRLEQTSDGTHLSFSSMFKCLSGKYDTSWVSSERHPAQS